MTLLVSGTTYSAQSSITELLLLLLSHLDDDDKTYLSDSQVFTLKSWLLLHAEGLEAGDFSGIQKVVETDPHSYELEAAIGKDENDQCFVWHAPLPWPCLLYTSPSPRD